MRHLYMSVFLLNRDKMTKTASGDHLKAARASRCSRGPCCASLRPRAGNFKSPPRDAFSLLTEEENKINLYLGKDHKHQGL